MISLTRDDVAVTARWGGSELFRYVYLPDDPQAESPRPYFHPVRTLRGQLVTVYRPHDHVWHKGIALSLPHVNAENFWGGPTFRDGRYVQLPNDGAMRHESFGAFARDKDDKDSIARFDERLRWVTESGQVPITERRRVAAAAWPDADAWVLAFETAVTNASGAGIDMGSPTTEGRPNAGYGGLFWRGPRSFTGGAVITPEGTGGDELMGSRGPWLAFAGRHDGSGGASTLVFRDAQGNFCHPTQWFVRSTPFAAVCPAPFFDKVRTLAPGETLTLSYQVVVADGELGPAACAALAARAAAARLIQDTGGSDLEMSERPVGSSGTVTPAAAAFPGGTGVTVLDVYDWPAPDGLPGGSAHVHLASTEGYVVLGGAGRLQTLGERGYAETPLRPGGCLWFTPGTIHRLVNDGGLRLLVVMQNAGLPEHDDAVLTFPPDVLADPAAYTSAASLTSDASVSGSRPGTDEALAAAARRRASLAVEGYLVLRERVKAYGPAALDDFYAAALRLTSGQAEDWHTRWRAGALAAAVLTGDHLAEIGAQVIGHLGSARLWRIDPPDGPRGYGMCGRLTTYPAARATRAG